MNVSLVSTDTLKLQPSIRIDRFPFVLGRREEVQLRVEDAHVSRQHCRFVLRDGEVLLEDLDSRNGTYVNEQEIHEPTAIFSGDRVRIGSSAYRCLHDHYANGTISMSIIPL